MRISVIGAAKSGIAAAKLAKRLGHSVLISEFASPDSFVDLAKEFESLGIQSEFGGHSNAILESDLVVISPGVKPSIPILAEAKTKGIEIISELEFAFRHCKNQIVAITGTNGKTTTTSLIEHVLNHAGKHAVACGNIGVPLSDLVLDSESDTIFVAEVSSYQLDMCTSFKPHVSIILNITPDHLAYHGSVENYKLAKWKIFKHQEENDYLFLCADNAEAAAAASHTSAQVRFFGMDNPIESGVTLRDSNIVFVEKHKEEHIMRYEELRLPGVHNAYNSMAAALAARAFEIRNENIRDALMSFAGVEHRLESVRVIAGVEFINDSKATNINATWYALQSFESPIILIAGGRGDNNDYSQLDEVVRKHVKAIICIGEDKEEIFNHFASLTRCIKAESLENAVSESRRASESGDVVLFSPACKSFDMFMNFEHRGFVFKEIVTSL